MREILFKAKRIDNGKWVEGYLFETKDNSYIGYDGQFDDDLFLAPKNIFIPIVKDTICQYTGLTDKNGNKIWENDIISYPQIHAKGNVAFVEDTFVLFDDYDGKQYIHGMWNKFKVIGNIFDNAELVKE